ncbi:MAG: carboxypeptidase-like regulatory domain-containing protein [Planctomycetota bacterium]
MTSCSRRDLAARRTLSVGPVAGRIEAGDLGVDGSRGARCFMTAASERARGVLFLAVAVVAIGFVVSFALIGGTGRGSQVDRPGPEPEEEAAREVADLVAPDAAGGSERVAEAASDDGPVGSLGEAPAAAGDAEGPTGSAFGTLLLPPGFPPPESVDVDGWLVELDPDGPLATLQPRRRDGTSDGLAWRVDGIRGGSWVFTATAETDGRVAYGAAAPKRVLWGEEGGPFRIVLHEYVVEGRVTDSSGAPLSGMRVEAVMSTPLPSSSIALGRSDSGSAAAESADADGGGWTEMQARADAARARAEAAREELLRKADAASSADRSRLESEIERAEAAVARALDERGRRIADFARIQQENEAVTDAAGAYRIALRAAGEVRVTAGRTETKEWVEATVGARVSEDAPRAIADLTVLRAAGLEGRLTRSDGGDPTEIEIVVRPLGSSGATLETNADAQGDFELFGFTPGPHVVYGRARIGQGRTLNVHGRVELAEGESLVVEDVLRPAARLVGRIVDGNGDVRPGSDVRIRTRIDPKTFHSARSDAAGRFEIDGIYACDYVLVTAGLLADGTRRVAVALDAGTIDVGDITVR